MNFSDKVEKKTEYLRNAILRHPFTIGIGDGTLDIEKFKFYVCQDYLYLIDYSKVLALASARSNNLGNMSWFARLLNETLNTEMELHREYCAKFGISRNKLEQTKLSPTTLAYTQYLLNIARHNQYPELVAALLPCQWGYWEIGNHLRNNKSIDINPLYDQWIDMYASNEFKTLADWIRKLADDLAKDLTTQDLIAMEQTYITSLRYEYLFWESCYNFETW